MKLYYPLLDTEVDILWRPLLDDEVRNELKDWTTTPYTRAPDLIVIGQLNFITNSFFFTNSHVNRLL